MPEIVRPSLLLLPNLLAEGLGSHDFFPQSVERAVQSMQGLIAESEKGGRIFLRLFGLSPHQMPMGILNEHTKEEELDALLAPLLKGECWGLVSDCGLPCLADPGAALVLRARELGVAIQAFVGPSSITLALMLSGLSGQRFAFHGYLEREEQALRMQIRSVERRSLQERETQLFIEAPYRSPRMLSFLIDTLSDQTLLSVAWDLTLPTENVMTQSIAEWKKRALPDLRKKPAIFLIFAREKQSKLRV